MIRATILTTIFLIVSFFGYSQYPIKTIFKGDSVVILTIKQSENINKQIDKQNKTITDLELKIKLQEQKLESLSEINNYLNTKVNELRETLSDKDSVISHFKSYSDSVSKENITLMDSIWNWSLGPSLIYSQYPDDSTMYILDLTMYYLTTDDFGIFMPRMSEREFEKYVKHIKELKQNPPAFREFDNSSEFEYIGKEKIKRRKVWKYRLKK